MSEQDPVSRQDRADSRQDRADVRQDKSDVRQDNTGERLDRMVLDLGEGVRAMAAATASLRVLIEKQYPTRREMEEGFVRKETTKKRLTWIFVTMLVSALVCFAGTVTTVSACFLGDKQHPDVCKLMPGYGEAQQNQEDLGKLLKRHEERISRLERGAR